MTGVLNYLRDLLRREPARFVSYGSAIVVWAVVHAAAAAGLVVPDDTVLAVGTLATFILTEIVRQFVYSPATVDQLTG